MRPDYPGSTDPRGESRPRIPAQRRSAASEGHHPAVRRRSTLDGARERDSSTIIGGSGFKLDALLDELPEDLHRQVFTHASWTDRRSDSYARLAFLGDSVLGLAVTTFLYPRLSAERYGAGRLTKIRAQAVSGAACASVAERIGVPERLHAAAPAGQNAAALVETERVLASVVEAVIGACYLQFGYDRTAEAVVEIFMPEIQEALEHPVDFK